MVLEKLPLGDTQINKNYVSNIDLYCSLPEKRRFAGERVDLNLFDRMTTVLLYSDSQKFEPSLDFHDFLAERTELYGISEMAIPDQALEKMFLIFFQNQCQNKEELSRLKSVYYPNLKGK